MSENKWNERGDAAAREDAALNNDIADIDEGAVLAHLGIFDADDTDARAHGLVGAELASAQRAALAGYREAAEALLAAR